MPHVFKNVKVLCRPEVLLKAYCFSSLLCTHPDWETRLLFNNTAAYHNATFGSLFSPSWGLKSLWQPCRERGSNTTPTRQLLINSATKVLKRKTIEIVHSFKKKIKKIGKYKSTPLVVNILEKVVPEHLKDNAVSQVKLFNAGDKCKTCRHPTRIGLGVGGWHRNQSKHKSLCPVLQDWKFILFELQSRICIFNRT